MTKTISFNDTLHYKVLDFFSRHLHQKIQINTLFEFLKKERISEEAFNHEFLDKEYVTVINNHIYLNYQNPYIFELKKCRDIYIIETFPRTLRHEIYLIYNDLIDVYREQLITIFLVGSAVKNLLTPQSDIDFFLITKDKVSINLSEKYSRTAQLIVNSESEFEYRFEERNEIIIWALTNGLILFDNNFISSYYGSQNLSIGDKSLQIKRKQIQNLIEYLLNSRNASDERIFDKVKTLLFQVARYIIIINSEIPLTKSEIPEQLKKYDTNFDILFEKLLRTQNTDRNTNLKIFYDIKNLFYDYINRGMNNKIRVCPIYPIGSSFI